MSQNITAHQAEEWLRTGEALLIDVREPDEFKAEHIIYAQSVPLNQVDASIKDMYLPADKKLIMHCLAGKRGDMACKTLRDDESFNRPVYNIEGGINAWKEAGFATVGAGAPKIPIFRQVFIIVGALILLTMALGVTGTPWALAFTAFFGAALLFAGVTGWCGMAMVLQKMPWNK